MKYMFLISETWLTLFKNFLKYVLTVKELTIFRMKAMILQNITTLTLQILLDRRQRGPIRSVMLVIIIGWLVTQFPQKWL